MRNGLVHVIAGLMVVVCCLRGAGSDCHAAVARQDDGTNAGAAAAGGAAIPAGGLLCDTSHRHVWFVIPAGNSSSSTTSATSSGTGGGGWQICHHAFDMNGAFYLPQATLPQQPVAIACWEDQVWMVLQTATGTENRREVFTISVVKDVAFGRYHSVPRDRLDIAPPLPGEGELVSFVGGPEGPVALIVRGDAMSVPRESASGEREGASFGREDEGDGEKQGAKPLAPLSILQLRSNRWVEIALPANLPGLGEASGLGSGDVTIAYSGADAATLNLLVQTQADQLLRYERVDGEWVKSEIAGPIDWRSVISIVHVAGQVAAVIAPPAANEIEISALRPGGLLRLASFRAPNGSWGVAGTDDTIYLLSRELNTLNITDTVLRTIHPLTGEMSEAKTLQVQPISATRLWQSALLLAAALIGLLLMFVIKPPAKDAVTLPKGITLLPPTSRLLAFALDVAPAVALVVFAMGRPFSEVLAMPITTLSFAESSGYLMTFGIVWGHTALSEIFFGRSLGKSLLDVRIVRIDGSKPRIMHMVLRNLIKPLVFLVPPLAAVALFNHHMQGLHDLVAGTLVVHEVEAETSGGARR